MKVALTLGFACFAAEDGEQPGIDLSVEKSEVRTLASDYGLVWILLGSGLVGLGCYETLVAVLYPRAVTGPVTGGLYWLIQLFFARAFRYSARLRHWLGPTLILAQLLCWLSLLLLGLSLIVWPHLGRGIVASGPQLTDLDFTTAVYFTGYTLSTLGMGDLVPITTGCRLLTVVASILGFSFFTLVLAYILSLYSALQRRNRLASSLAYRRDADGQLGPYLRSHLLSEDHTLLAQDFHNLSESLADLLEGHHFYPALHYFQFGPERYSMESILEFPLEASTITYAWSAAGFTAEGYLDEAAHRLWRASSQVLEDALKFFAGNSDRQEAERDEHVLCVTEWLRRSSPSQDIAPEKLRAFANCYRQRAKLWRGALESLGESPAVRSTT